MIRKVLAEPLVPIVIALILLAFDASRETPFFSGFLQSGAWANGNASSAGTAARDTSSAQSSGDRRDTGLPGVETGASGMADSGGETSIDGEEDRWEVVIDPRDLIVAPPAANAAPLPVASAPVYSNAAPAASRDVTNFAPMAAEELPEAESGAYLIRPGDQVDVFVWGQETLSGASRVSRDGTIVVRLAGSVRIEGLTVDQAAARIASRLRRYLIQPAVTVSIPEPGGKDVSVVGEVDMPGSFRIDRPTRLLDVLVQAKWNRERADLSAVTVARGERTLVCDIASVLRGQRIDQNVLIEAGDLVIVPGLGQTVSLLGAFLKPGKFTFPASRALRVRDLLLEGSTWTARANIAGSFVLHPDGSIEPCNLNRLWFGGDAREDKVLRSGDALIIPELSDVGVYVLGKVGNPGLHTRSGAFSLLQALTLANPSTFHARLYDVRVVRGWPDNPRVYRVNVKALLEGDLSQNLMLEPGDVVFVPEGIISYSLQFWNGLLGPITGTASTITDVRDTIEGER